MEQTETPPLTSNGNGVAGGHEIVLSIIIVSYNCRDLVLACLRSVRAAIPYARGVDIIVVDNASVDGTVDAIAEEFPEVRRIPLPENVGFGRGCNVGASEARSPLILLLNPDTTVRPQTLENLLGVAAEYPNAGIWGGRTMADDGTVVAGSCWRFPTLWSTFCVTTGLSRAFSNSAIFNREAYGGWRRDDLREVEVVSGCLLLIRMELWRQLGGFDPTFFLYSEEVDLCLRARRLGARPLISPDAEVRHYAGGTQPIHADRLIRLLTGKRTYMFKHWSRPRRWVGGILLLAWPLSRIAAIGFAGRIVSRRNGPVDASAWVEVWRRRHEWYPGDPLWDRADR
jgi:hypothetical protein